MKYEILDDKIIIDGIEDFNPKHILECGQIFRYYEFKGEWFLFSANKTAKIVQNSKKYCIFTKDTEYFADYFDLNKDYSKIKKALLFDNNLQKTIPFGSGIRILKGDLVEIMFSFVISANNNISRIQKIIEKLCAGAGQNMGNFYAFPTLEKLSSLPLDFYSSLGAGYRDKYLFKLSRELSDCDLENKKKLSTNELRKWLITLSGIGPKVADCILLFGFHRTDVFPVDTWIEKVYKKCYYSGEKNRTQIANFFVDRFGVLSGYAQQYLFYGARSFDILK